MCRIISLIMVFILLVIYTVTDMKDKKVWWPLAVIASAGGIAAHLIAGDRSLPGCIYSLLPGLMLAALSFVSGEAIGYGDCLTIMAIGALAGMRHVCAVTFAALMLASMWAILLLFKKGAGKKTRFPFIPFLLAAHVIVVLV